VTRPRRALTRLERHNQHLDHGRRLADRMERRLAHSLQTVLDRAADQAARNFRAKVTDHLTAAAPTTGSTMVACFPQADEAAALAQPGGEPAEILHVTLAFLGEPSDEQYARARQAVAQVAAEHVPRVGKAGGIGTFGTERDFDEAVSYPSIVMPDVPGLAELRHAVVRALEDAGIDFSREHDFNPHLTLAYTEEPTLPPTDLLGLPLTFNRLTLARGDVPEHFPLLGPADGEEPPYPAGGIRATAYATVYGLAASDTASDTTEPEFVTAAGNGTPPPAGWTAPAGDELIDVAALAAALSAKTDPVREAAVKAMVAAAIDDVGVGFDIEHPLVGRALAQAGSQVTNVAETTRANVMRAVMGAHAEGLSIPETVKLIRAGMKAANPARATMIARTELGRAVNGAAVAATQIVSSVTGESYSKTWLTAAGAPYPRHELYDGLDGQTVPLNEPFDVGGFPMQYPGDPDGPEEESLACRCAVIFGGEGEQDAEELAAAAALTQAVRARARSRLADSGILLPGEEELAAAALPSTASDEGGDVARGATARQRRSARRSALPEAPGVGKAPDPEQALTAGATTFKDYPLSDRGRVWDAAAADGRWRTKSGSGDAPSATYRDGFFWFDGDAPDVYASFKLGYVDVIDGTTTAVWRGVTACAGVMQGARGGVQIPDGDRDAVKNHIGKYYAAAREQYDDPSLVQPWEAGEASSAAEALARAEAGGDETLYVERLAFWDDAFDVEIEVETAECECGHMADQHDGGDGACMADGCDCEAYTPAEPAEVAAVLPSLDELLERASAEQLRGFLAATNQGNKYAVYAALAEQAPQLPAEHEPADTRPAANPSPAEAVPVQPTRASALRWEAAFAPEGRRTDDGRIFAPGAISWRDLPLSLMAMTETADGHDGAVVAGRVDRIWRDGTMIRGAGVFDDSEFGREIARMVGDGVLRGLSVDIAIREYEVGPQSAYLDEDGNWKGLPEQPAEEEPLDLIEILFGEPETEPTLYVVTDGVIGAATVCSFPAFADAEISLAASGAVWTVRLQGGFTIVGDTRAQSPRQIRREKVLSALTAASTGPVAAETVETGYDLTRGSLAERYFYKAAVESGYSESRRAFWPCEAELSDVGAVLFREADAGVYRLDDGTLVYLGISDGWLRVECCASTRPQIAETLAEFTTRFPPLYRQQDSGTVPVTFWADGRFGPTSRLRRIEANPWPAIEGNYPAAVQAALARLMDGFEPGKDGQLLLWQGPPGTGKTWALRALASEWADCAEFHYITDPDAFFVTNPSYLIDVLLHDSYEELEPDGTVVTAAGGGKWRVLIFEDTGELLSADAKEAYGQGLSRLLNVVDGMIGQGLRVLAIVTTNDELGELHPAVVRPGRCASQIEFAAFDAEEASEWLGETTGAGTLAELYARKGDGAVAFPEAGEVEPEPSLTASAAGLVAEAPPAEWFTDPGLQEATALTIDDDGRVYGHAALFDSCHLGFPDVCTTAPRSLTGYSLFHLGEVVCADGERVPCGKVTLGTGHADRRLGWRAAAEHYDDCGTVVAYVVTGEDEHGIWVAGALNPDVSESRVREFRASVLSGDWRNVNGNLELVALLAVNVPGFPVPRRPRALVAAGEEGTVVLSLTSAGLPWLRPGVSGAETGRLRALAARAAGGIDGLARLAEEGG
jgi:2'-5' RNA ligase